MGVSLPAILCGAVVILAAQPDPLRDCRRQASVATGAAVADVDTRVYQFLILWTAKDAGRALNGYCEADQAGRIVHFEVSPRGLASPDPAGARPSAIDDCRRQASISSGEEIANIETRMNLDLILWQVKAGIRRIEGFCQTDSRTGRIVRFDAARPEIEDLLSPDDAEVTCRRAARLRLGADDDEVQVSFERADSRSGYRIEWRYGSQSADAKTGWCTIDSRTGRVRKLEAAGGW